LIRSLEGTIVPDFEASPQFCDFDGLARSAYVNLLLVCHRRIPQLRLGLVSDVSTGGVLRGR